MNETNEAPTYDLLDVIVALSEKWIVIFAVPIVLSILAFFVAQNVERQWTAQAELPTASDAASARTPDLYMLKMSAAYPELTVEKSDGRYHLKTITSSDLLAGSQAKAAAAELSNLLKAGTDQDVLRLESGLENLRKIIAQISADNSPAYQTVIAYALTGITREMEDMITRRDELQFLQTELAIPPKVTVSSVGPSPFSIATATAVLSALGISAFLSLQFIWREVSNRPENLSRINRIRKAFYFRPRS